jgi:magnesium transporter
VITRYVQRHLTWIDLVHPSTGDIRSIMAEFDIDPVIADELTSPSPKSRAEKRGSLLFLVLHFPTLRTLNSRPEHEIDFIVGKDFLITTRYANIDPLHSFAKAFEVNTVLNRGGAEHGGHLFVGMVRDLYRSLLLESDRLHEKLDEIEDLIFSGREREMVAQISVAGRIIHDFRRTLEPHRLMLESLEPYGERLFGAGFAYHMRAILGEHARVQHTLEHLKEWLQELRETNNSLLTTKQNDTMKKFTVLAFVFLPLSFIAGLFGMNTANNPIVGSPADFWIIVAGMAILAGTFFAYFKRKDWL